MQEFPGAQTDASADVARPPQLLEMEVRVLGALMEKQLTTPEQYPLTLNSVITACNQKSSREPVTQYHQGEILRCLNELEQRHLVRKEYGSRSDKYSQQFMARLDVGKKQQAVLCVLMLRGPQTISELSTRTQRMQQFNTMDELIHCVERLCEREQPLAMPLVIAGQRGERIAHLFSGTPASLTNERARVSESGTHHENNCDSSTDLATLKQAIHQLEQENHNLKQQLRKLYELTGHELPNAK